MDSGLVERGFGLFRCAPLRSRHAHDAIELDLFEYGSVTMLYSGRVIKVPPGHLVVYWGIQPHQMLDRDPNAQVVGLHLPLVWFLQWDLPKELVAAILGLEVLIEPVRNTPCSDLALLRNWVHLVENKQSQGQEIVLAELRGRLLRLASRLVREDAGKPASTFQPVTPGIFGRAVEFIAEHFRDPIHIADIAAAAGVSRTHLMRTFRTTSSWTVNEYVTHLRISHAQRLLVTTDDKVIDIMYNSGFNSPNRFYEAFSRQTGSTPARYRRSFRVAKHPSPEVAGAILEK